MFKILSVLCILPVCASVAQQAYKPAHGETDLKLDIQGRGSVYLKLFTDEAPKTTTHIAKLVKDGFYDGLRFHRVVKSPKPYLIQLGDPNTRNGALDDSSKNGSGESIQYEDSGHQNIEGAVGLAGDLQQDKSGDSQFYILLATSKFLDGDYTVFGQVVSGMDVVRNVERGDRIEHATIVKGR